MSLRAIPFQRVTVDDPFWSRRQEINRTVTVPVALARCEETGRIDNFAKAGRLMAGPFRGIYYDDSDVYKVIEGIAYSLATHPDAELDAYLDGLIAKIAAAQEPDGYLYTVRTIDPAAVPAASGPERWSRLKDSHELYNVGHLYEAAVAHHLATGKRSLLDVALKNAELILKTFGPGLRRDPPGHQEIEIGLVKLFYLTRDRRHLELAAFFLDERGRADGHVLYGEYAQDHLPVLQQREAVGHAVRALYMYSAMADVAAATGDDRYLPVLRALWEDIVGKKLAITGGVGARKSGESLGAPYELPNAASYNETCAAIANVFFNHRMFLFTGDARYIDVLERTLYNGLISGVSISGDRFFYVNPLASDGVTPFNYGEAVSRAPWFKCSCCPVNLVRFIASLGGYIYAVNESDSTIYVLLYIGSDSSVTMSGAHIRLRQGGDYPAAGVTHIDIEACDPLYFTIALRLPGWARYEAIPTNLYRFDRASGSMPHLFVNGELIPIGDVSNGFIRITREWRTGDTIEWQWDMTPRWIRPHDAIEATRGSVALQRGPIVYCFESIDNAWLDSPDATVDVSAADPFLPKATDDAPHLAGVSALVAGKLTAIPYFAWAHRGASRMTVWLQVNNGQNAHRGGTVLT